MVDTNFHREVLLMIRNPQYILMSYSFGFVFLGAIYIMCADYDATQVN